MRHEKGLCWFTFVVRVGKRIPGRASSRWLVADAIGDIPQNVNFAIRAEIAKLFLYQNGVEPIEVAETAPLPPEDLAEIAQGFTKLVVCE